MEETLRENLLLLQSVVENAPLPIGVYLGEELKIALANEAMIKVWGKGNDVIGRYYTEILPELESQKIFSQARSVIRTGIPFHAKNSPVDIIINGVLKPHYFNYSFTPIKDSNGATYAVMNTGADVTDLDTARQQVQEAEEKLRLAVASAELGIYEVDLTTNKITTSGNFHGIWGTTNDVTREDIINKIHPEDLWIRDEAHKEAQVTGNISYELRIIPKSNALRWVRISGKIISDTSGNHQILLGIVQDITEQKQFSEELKKLVTERTAELNKSNEDLLQFANIVSHDLKEPVRKINIFNNLLKDELSSLIEGKNKAYFDKVQHSTQRMTSIIEGVLSYSKLNKTGHLVKEVNLDKIIEDIKTDLELIVQEKKAILMTDEMPIIEGAPILIHQLFYNLIHNALKFSRPDNPPQVIISCSTSKIKDVEYIRISIRDNGIGFDPIYADKIFNDFERLHSKDAFEGTGLGLSLCKKIVIRHHGTIEAIGNHGEGAEFVVTLPLKQKGNKI
nr:ATP-binding protein [Flavobacterium sp. ASV13]